MMTAEQLRASILQLAIEGKLVEQKPEEGTGEELYQQIQTEKAKLIKEGKIKKQKPLPEITNNEKPFDIPVNWRWVRLRDICTKLVDGDHNPPKGLAYKTDYWMLSAKNVNQDRLVDLDSVRYLSEDIFARENERTFVTKGDIFLTTVATLGRSCVYEGNYKICFQRSVSVINTLAYNYFLKYVLDSGYIQSMMREEATGTAQKGFYLQQLEKVCIPLPPLEEQHRIVEKIEELKPYVQQYAAAFEKLDKLNTEFPERVKKSILQMAVEGKLVEQRPEEGTGEELYRKIQEEKAGLIKEGKIKKQKTLAEITDEEKPFDIPDSWIWIRLKDLGEFSSGKTPSMSDVRNWQNGKVSWITSKDMKKKYLSISQMLISEYAASEMKLYPPNTMLMVVRSGILKRMLPVSILKANSTINQDIKALSLYYPDICEYIYVVLKGMETYILQTYRKQVTTVDSLRFEDFQNMPIPIPPEQEQRRILLKLKTILPEIEQLNK